ncbi:MAG: hypothetical protein IJ995_03975 [Clostridia bacterium]|nr:hypothetical protein [Clostridia bacterium]
MITTKRKKQILLWVLIAVLLIGAAVTAFFLLYPKKPDAKALLEGADSLSKQNLCLTALLEEEPANKTYQEQLLANYAALGADPLTIYALEQKYGIQAAPAAQTAPEQAGAVLNRGGIAGMAKYKDAYAVAQGADTTYYATSDGIYADYCGLEQRIAAIGASHLIAAENGVYFLNDVQRKVQYIARDGHKIETLSPMDAVSFALFGDALWIIDTNYDLYCNEKKIESEHKVRALAAASDTLYAACNDESGAAMGVLAIDQNGAASMALPSKALSIFGGEDGCLYYINEFGLPMRYRPATKEATFLSEKKAIAVTYEQQAVYILNEKGKVKKIKVTD